jgi:hypothetical protein
MNNGTAMRINIPKTLLTNDKRDHKAECTILNITHKRLWVTTYVAHDMFLIDYMLNLIQKYSIPLSIFGTRNVTKEISEASAGIYYATSFAIIGTTKCYVIGEGTTPRISWILGKLHPEWDIVSIDPLIRAMGSTDVTYIADYDYNVDISDYQAYENVVIIGIHSHNKMRDFYENIQSKNKLLIAMPCCVKLRIPSSHAKPTYNFICPGVFSGCNRIFIYSPFEPIREIINPAWTKPTLNIRKGKD